MNIIGIICEYNPLHLGHKKQLDTVRTQFPDGGIVCLMSGNYVQRGKPAIVDKSLRAQAAVLCGADLVLELPLTAAVSSAEGFAAEGVRILSGFCDTLCFGAESGDKKALMTAAKALSSPKFSEALHMVLDKGVSFPAARQAALDTMGIDADMLTRPNDILAVEYCKAIVIQGVKMQLMPIVRQGDYHDKLADPQNPSATSIRDLMRSGGDWQDHVPANATKCFENAVLHTLEAGERAVLARLRTMTDAEFEALPYDSEGLWRKLMHAARRENTLEDILTATKSKRYTRTRLDRMVMCAFLGLTKDDLASPAPYVRVLAFNDKGRQILKEARRSGTFVNAGQAMDSPYQAIETRAGDLYGLFAQNAPESPNRESARRVYYSDLSSEIMRQHNKNG